MYLCPSCAFPNRLATRQALECHLATTHFDCRPYSCEACRGAAKFPTAAALQRHCEADHAMTRYKVLFAPTEDERYQLEQISALVAVAEAKRNSERNASSQHSVENGPSTSYRQAPTTGKQMRVNKAPWRIPQTGKEPPRQSSPVEWRSRVAGVAATADVADIVRGPKGLDAVVGVSLSLHRRETGAQRFQSLLLTGIVPSGNCCLRHRSRNRAHQPPMEPAQPGKGLPQQPPPHQGKMPPAARRATTPPAVPPPQQHPPYDAVASRHSRPSEPQLQPPSPPLKPPTQQQYFAAVQATGTADHTTPVAGRVATPTVASAVAVTPATRLRHSTGDDCRGGSFPVWGLRPV